MKRRTKILLAAGAAIIAALAYATRDVSRLRLAHRGGPVTSIRNLTYRAGSRNPKHRLDVYVPEGASKAARAPVVHFIHGGYWVGGDKDYQNAITGLYGSVGEALAAQGVITVVQSYRLVPEVTFDDLLDDILTALKYTEDHLTEWGGDPARLFVMGHSAGGHITALLATDDAPFTKRGMNPDAVKGYIPLSAVWDIEDMSKSQDGAFQQRVTYPVFGSDSSKWAAYSPLAKLSAKARPMLVLIGDHDYPYLIPQAERARDRLTELGHPPQYYVAKGNDHDAMVLHFGARNDNVTDVIVHFVKGS